MRIAEVVAPWFAYSLTLFMQCANIQTAFPQWGEGPEQLKRMEQITSKHRLAAWPHFEIVPKPRGSMSCVSLRQPRAPSHKSIGKTTIDRVERVITASKMNGRPLKHEQENERDG